MSKTINSSSSIISWLVWPLIILLPLILTTNELYKNIFPLEWYDKEPTSYYRTNIWPSPLGLSLGLGAVVIGQIFMLLYFCIKRSGLLGYNVSIQRDGARPYDLSEGLKTHLAQPEGFIMLGSYLIGTWMFGLMPSSYYSFSGNIEWHNVLLQLLLQDFIQFCFHQLEHLAPAAVYKASHKPHHRFTNPRLFDAFNGSAADTFIMILIPLFLTAQIVHTNVWSYMVFGSLYANWLTLIHCEYSHPWDGLFRLIGFGTSGDHHVHHKLFIYNYGHLFMYWDKIFGTYKSPLNVSVFNKEL